MSEISSPEQELAKKEEHIGLVQKYYTEAQEYFERLWHKTGLHYGIWKDGVKNRAEAILKENEILADLANIEIMEKAGFVNTQNLIKTDLVMKSAAQMTKMCKRALPATKILVALHLVPPFLVPNNQWGTYQEGLFKSGATSYNILVATKPE